MLLDTHPSLAHLQKTQIVVLICNVIQNGEESGAEEAGGVGWYSNTGVYAARRLRGAAAHNAAATLDRTAEQSRLQGHLTCFRRQLTESVAAATAAASRRSTQLWGCFWRQMTTAMWLAQPGSRCR